MCVRQWRMGDAAGGGDVSVAEHCGQMWLVRDPAVPYKRLYSPVRRHLRVWERFSRSGGIAPECIVRCVSIWLIDFGLWFSLSGSNWSKYMDCISVSSFVSVPAENDVFLKIWNSVREMETNTNGVKFSKRWKNMASQALSSDWCDLKYDWFFAARHVMTSHCTAQ